MEPPDRRAFLAGLSKVLTLPSNSPAATDAAALDAAWWGELQSLPWVTVPIWERAVSEAMRTCTFRPGFAELLGICEFAASVLEQEAWRAQAAAAGSLPPPTGAAADVSATPEERERWAREDAFIRGHMPGVMRQWKESAYLDDWGPHPTKPGVYIRTAPEDMAHLADSRKYDEAISKVPDMTIEQRRARDRRIEVARAQARAALQRGRWRPAAAG